MSAPIQRQRIPSPPPLLGGGRLKTLDIGYRTWGRLSPEGDNAVLVCPALTGDSDLAHWWPALLGPGRALDPQRDFIICADVLGGSGRTTGPGSRAADGQPWGERFPEITVRDMVQVQGLLLDRLGVERLRLVIGGSLGGMQVLEWLVSAHQRIDAAVVIAAAARQSAWARAFNHVQRRALVQHGDIELARMVAMLSYRHWDNLDGRFDQPERQPHPAEDWLNHHGLALKSRFDPVSYQRLMGSMDSHDLGRDRGSWERALAAIPTPVQLIGIQSDLLYPPRDQQRLADALPNAWLDWLEADQGHDAFLIEQAALNELVTAFLQAQAHPRVKRLAARQEVSEPATP